MELNGTFQSLLLLAIYCAQEDGKYDILERLRGIYDDLYAGKHQVNVDDEVIQEAQE
jgi:hypothetical protein